MKEIIIFIIAAILIAVCMLIWGITQFWPLILVIGLVWLLVYELSDKK